MDFQCLDGEKTLQGEKKTTEGANQLKKFFEIKIMLNIWIGKVVFQNKR